MNSLLLAKNAEEARKPEVYIQELPKTFYRVTWTEFGFCNPDLNNRALIAPTRSFKVNNKDSFRDLPPVIILSSVIMIK